MNDTKNRLRDYLQTKAGTVPDAAQGPGLQLDATGTPTKRGWIPIVLAAATIGAVLVLAVPFLTRLADKQPTVADSPAAMPTGPVSTGAPRIPYAVTVHNNPDNPLDTWWAVIQDGKQKVKNPGVRGEVLARLGGGWLVKTGYPDPKKSQAAIVDPKGKVTPLGPTGATYPVISPDGRQLAVAVAPYGAKDSRVVVVNVEDGKETARLDLPMPSIRLIGWNKDGIWLTPELVDSRPVSVWQPGADQPRTVEELGLRGELQVVRSSDVVVQLSGNGIDGYCAKAATLGAKGLELKREYCFETVESDQAAAYVALSPEGRTMVLSTRVAVDIATGKATKLGIPAKFGGWTWNSAVFEDPATVIVLADTRGVKPLAQKMFRCSVTTGECKAILTSKSNESLAAVRP
ncbi:hypothetical protein [Streptomyces sp. SID13031]|uniref:hypothetical protein n=1 Tax=Streptomyces sp. SID13031 TaxID=2706046 RepID=UPI0013C96DED|nr:hypothetical protein [Streptomyces sp. SID13031]NEA31255.1 hypothetical protein [Streptomyces sp. SID13031]